MKDNEASEASTGNFFLMFLARFHKNDNMWYAYRPKCSMPVVQSISKQGLIDKLVLISERCDRIDNIGRCNDISSSRIWIQWIE